MDVGKRNRTEFKVKKNLVHRNQRGTIVEQLLQKDKCSMDFVEEKGVELKKKKEGFDDECEGL